MTHPTQPDRDDASTPPDRETVAREVLIEPQTASDEPEIGPPSPPIWSAP